MDINVDALIAWITSYSIKIVAALLVFIIGKWVARKIANLFSRLMVKNNVDEAVVGFVSNLAYYALFVVVIIAALGQLGVKTTSFLAIVGAAGLAIGLALKDS
jgi:small conductance mechanosensitive channel